MFRKFSFSILFSVIFFSFSSLAYAAGPYGTWVRSNGVHISVYSCEGGLGMKIVKASKKENVGRVIMCGAKSDQTGKWKGNILNLDDGKTYTGFVTLPDRKTLKLEGCILGGLICKSDEWVRLR